jgi:hypothetical protein
MDHAGVIEKVPADAIHLNMASVSLAMARRPRFASFARTEYVSAPVFGRPQPGASVSSTSSRRARLRRCAVRANLRSALGASGSMSGPIRRTRTS